MAPSDGFATTHWSVVLDAGGADPERSARAFSALCHAYWAPIHAYVRRRARRGEEPRDLTQEFFTRLLAGSGVRGARAERGRFRAYLLGALEHFLADERERANALKRGAGALPLSLDFDEGETRFRIEPTETTTPERLFDREWALALLDSVLARARDEARVAGKERQYTLLEAYLVDEDGCGSYAEAARELGTTEGALRMAAMRLRARFRELLREEVSQTVAREDQVDDEIRGLFEALRVSPGQAEESP